LGTTTSPAHSGSSSGSSARSTSREPTGSSDVEYAATVNRCGRSGQHDDPGRRLRGAGHNLPGGADPVEDRHADIHEDDVGVGGRRQFDRAGAVAGLADHLQAGSGGEQRDQSGPDQRLVVGDQGADRAHSHRETSLNGRRATTPKPPPSTGPAVRTPP
jgi:hypothetical protein